MKPSLQKKLDYVLLKPLPIKKNTVFFQSFGGQYNDNPKYISERLHELSPSTEIIWAISSEKCNVLDIPDYILQVEMSSRKYAIYSCKSQVVVDNMTGIRGSVRKKSSRLIRNLLSSRRQLNISTWHGTPIKRIGLDTMDNQNNLTSYVTSSDYLISGCQYTFKHLQSAFSPINVICCGTPRNDILINRLSPIMKDNIRKKLELPVEKKIILFAPTFRDSVEYSGVTQIETFDIESLLSILNRKFGGDWVFVFRVHHEVLKKIDIEKLRKAKSTRIYNGNLHDDMAEYLAVSDALITDYSGSVFDFALTGRPGFLYVPDKEHYIKEERGTYISLDELPYPHADTLEDFYKLIENFDGEAARKRIVDFNERIGNVETGKASEIIAKRIIKFLETGEKEI